MYVPISLGGGKQADEGEQMRITEAMHESAIGELDRLITSAYEAKQCLLKKQYEDAASYLDDAAAARKNAEALINEMWE